jgi:purine-nucleoside phosphorylase
MLRAMGADLVGISTVLEVIAARHAGMKVAGLALVTNLAAGLGLARLSHDEVLAAGVEARDRVGRLVAAWAAEAAR